MSDRVEKERVSVTLTRPYLDALDKLVEVGIYLDHQDAIRDALHLLLGVHGISPFWGPERPPEKGEEVARGPSEGS